MENIDTLLSLGVSRVVLSSSILRNRELTGRIIEKYGEKVIPGVDGRDGMVATEGFTTSAATSVINLLADLKNMGVRQIIYTDLRRCGAMKGPNFESIGDLLLNSGLKAFIAGGINSYQAIERLKDMGASGLIIGKAIYTGAIDLQHAEEIARR